MKFLCALFLWILFPAVMPAQELNATVEVNFQNLPVVNKEILQNFANDLQTYINNTKYTSGQWREKLNCSFNISITSAQGEMSYTAQLVVISQRRIYKTNDYSPMLRVLDPNWNFNYQRNQAFYYNPNVFDAITSLLDYYAYVIIGMEEDTWKAFAGNPLFTRANDIVNLGRNSGFSKGWETSSGYNRSDFIENLLNEKYSVVRQGIADYHYALDMLSQKNIPASKKDQVTRAAQEKIAGFIRSIDQIKAKIDIRGIFVKSFFEAKFGEIIEKLRTYPDKQIFSTLKAIDPPHASKYDEAMRN